MGEIEPGGAPAAESTADPAVGLVAEPADGPAAQSVGESAAGENVAAEARAEGYTEDGALFDAGPGVVKLPAALSPSRAGDFQQCPLLFRLRVVDKVPEPPNAAATKGTLVHAVLERLFDLPADRRTPGGAVELLRPQWERLLAEKPELGGLFANDEERAGWLGEAEKLLGTYFTLEDPTRLEPAKRELFVRAPMGEGEDRLLLRGFVDRLDIAPNGMLRVVDYKTGKAPPPGYEEKTLFQMKFYALVLWKVRGVVPKRLQLLFLGNGEVLTYDPTEADLLLAERKIASIWASIRKAAEAGRWEPKVSKLCGWCSFRELCPAQGGAEPPVPEVRIVPTSA
jgi:putative RecB family exonuclease